MKKIFLILGLFLFLIPFASSAIELNRNNYIIGETVVAKLTFEYAPNEISTEHINIYDEYGKKVSVPYYVVKFSDSLYYVYFTIPQSLSHNYYQLAVGPYFYGLGGVLQKNTDYADINIIEGRDLILSIDPGAAVIDLAKQDYFYLNLKNNGNNGIDLSLKLVDGTLNYNNYKIQSGDSLKIKGTVDSIGEKTMQVIYDSSEYLIPVLVIDSRNIIEKEASAVKPINAIKFTNVEDSVNVIIEKGDIMTGSLRFVNTWTSNISNIKLSLSDDLSEVVRLSATSFSFIMPNEVKTVTITVDGSNILKDYIGEVRLTADGVSVSYPVYIHYQESDVQEQQEVTSTEEPPVATTSEEQEKEKQIEMKTGVFFAIIVIMFVIFIIVIILMKSRKYKPKDFILSR